ncbi:hypothetical protein HDE_14518 [Halotydeus destructor]|nr:hypothetical protein HDE_14518 [Halotydeus destructor]
MAGQQQHHGRVPMTNGHSLINSSSAAGQLNSSKAYPIAMHHPVISSSLPIKPAAKLSVSSQRDNNHSHHSNHGLPVNHHLNTGQQHLINGLQNSMMGMPHTWSQAAYAALLAGRQEEMNQINRSMVHHQQQQQQQALSPHDVYAVAMAREQALAAGLYFPRPSVVGGYPATTMSGHLAAKDMPPSMAPVSLNSSGHMQHSLSLRRRRHRL